LMSGHGSSRKHAKRTPRTAGAPESGRTRAADARKSSPVKPFPDYESAMGALRQRLNVEQLRPSQVDAGKGFNLDRLAALREALGNPHKGSYKTIHVAGSKGKGSTCEMTASALQACGYAVGLFTSPHLMDVSERIRINQRPISREEMTALLARVFHADGEMPKR